MINRAMDVPMRWDKNKYYIGKIKVHRDILYSKNKSLDGTRSGIVRYIAQSDLWSKDITAYIFFDTPTLLSNKFPHNIFRSVLKSNSLGESSPPHFTVTTIHHIVVSIYFDHRAFSSHHFIFFTFYLGASFSMSSDQVMIHKFYVGFLHLWITNMNSYSSVLLGMIYS